MHNNYIFNYKISGMYILHFIMMFVAVFLSRQCSGDNINYFSLFFALLFPEIYVLYILSTNYSVCGLLKK